LTQRSQQKRWISVFVLDVKAGLSPVFFFNAPGGKGFLSGRNPWSLMISPSP